MIVDAATPVSAWRHAGRGPARPNAPVARAVALSALAHALALALTPAPTTGPGAMRPRPMEVHLAASASSAPAAPAASPTALPALPVRIRPQPAPALSEAVPGPAAERTTREPAGPAVPAPAEAEAKPAPAPPAVQPPDLAAAYASNPPPPYPLAARRRGLEGRVVLRAEILADGHCGRLEVQSSSGHAVLDEAAAATVKTWRFLPARRAGEPVAAWVEIPIVFRLTDS